METITLQVSGMTCGGCVASIGRALQAQPGVIDVNASLESGEVEVQVEGHTVDRASIAAAVEAAGFDVIG